MKANNHLTSLYFTIYECEELKRDLERIDPNKTHQENDYILIEPINVDRQFRDQQIIEVLGCKFIFTNEIPKGIIKNNNEYKEFYKSNKSVIFYRDPFLEEKLFVHLFPKGVGGYNSTFYKYMPLNQYIKMRLLSGYTDAFRNDKRYILFFYDWIRKKRINDSNNYVKVYKLNEVNREFIKHMYN